MNIPKKINDMINVRIMGEGKAANAYLQIAAWFENQNLSGFGKYFTKQAEDEIGHKNRLIQYLNVRTDGVVRMLSVPEITIGAKTLVEIAELYVSLEEETTSDIYNITKAALDNQDFMTHQEMLWFIEEQKEEENSAQAFLAKAKLLAENGVGIVLWNNELEEDD